MVGLCGPSCDGSDPNEEGEAEADGTETGDSTTSPESPDTGESTASPPPADSGSTTSPASTSGSSTGDATTGGPDSSGDGSSSTGASSGCAFPDSVFLSGTPFDGWAYLCFDRDTGACGLVQGSELELDVCGEISGTPAVQFFHAISEAELSLRSEDDSINPWEFVSSTHGALGTTLVDDVPFDEEMTVTLQPVGSSTTYELVLTFGFMGAAEAQIASFEVVR
ncbi:MAG: hypothetical protein AAF721_05880 [Myxococcota bacterium]